MTDKTIEPELERFKSDIATDADVNKSVRDEANSDMRFINVTGGMWEDYLTEDFGDNRVKLEMDLVSNPLQRFIGEWNQNRVGVEYKPDDAGTTKDDSNLLNGIYRSDFRQFSGKMSTDNAVDEAATCGFGAFKLSTVFENDEDPENDNMKIEWRPKYNAYATVFFDQAAKRIDKKDARWCTELEQFTHDSFLDQWPHEPPVSAHTPERFNFTSDDVSVDIVYIATRYEVIKKKITVFVYNDLKAGKVVSYEEKQHKEIKSELDKDVKEGLKVFVRKRKMATQIVEKTVFSGDTILEPTRRIAGKWIPVIPFYGYRSYVDGAEWYRGLVRKMKDGQRLFNTQISQLAENAASGGQEVPIFDPAQMENQFIQDAWADKNNKPYLLADSLVDPVSGAIIAHGPLAYSKPAQLDASTANLVGLIPQFMQDMAGGPPQESQTRDMSGKAIRALMKRENMSTQVINDNIANAIAWSGTVYQAIAAEIYTTKRMVKTISRDGTEGDAQLLEIAADEQTGMPIETNDLRGKRFQSYSDVGPQYETQREQTVEETKGMMEALGDNPAAQEYMPMLLSVMINNISGVGLEGLKDFNRRKMISQGLVKAETPEEKAFVEQISQPKEDPQQQLLQAAAQQQMAEARNLDSDSQDNLASAEKKRAETAKIMSEVGNARIKIIMDGRAAQQKALATGVAR